MKNCENFDSSIFEEVLTYEGVGAETSRELRYPFPGCNHVSDITEYNAGYARGVLGEGIPFEAEVFANAAEEVWLAVVMPACCGEDTAFMDFEPCSESEKSWNNSVLVKNMQELGSCEAFLPDYNELLLENELFTMDCGRVPGRAKYFLDSENKLLVQVFVGLMEKGERLNYSDLELINFENI